MENEIQKMVRELQEIFGLSRAGIAAKMGVSEMTIYRWTKGICGPDFAGTKMLTQIYNGYKARAS